MWKRLWNPVTWSFENGKYLAGIMDELGIMCDEIIESNDEEKKLFQQILMKRKSPVERKISIFYLYFYQLL